MFFLLAYLVPWILLTLNTNHARIDNGNYDLKVKILDHKRNHKAHIPVHSPLRSPEKTSHAPNFANESIVAKFLCFENTSIYFYGNSISRSSK